LSLKEKLEGKSSAKTTKPTDYIGSGKSCPMYGSPHHFSYCRNDCEWNDGEGCAVWRIVRALEHLVRLAVDGIILKGGDSK